MSSRRSNIPDAAAGRRDSFALDELAIVLSHYDLGVIRRVREFARGSRKAPKLIIESETGTYLLKRRARGRDELAKVMFTHAMQGQLVEQQFPLPHLIGTKRGNDSLFERDGAVYEMFEYIAGDNYPGTLDATFDSGRVLSLFHKLLEDFHTDFRPAQGSYHAATVVETGLKSIPARLGGGAPVISLCRDLLDAYRAAKATVDGCGYAQWPVQIVHGDWHPGNMLFREDHVVAVIDYDSARQLPKAIDVANAVLQFSILGGSDDVSQWPDYLDESRFKRFLLGYDKVQLLSQAEVDALPHLMVEALIAEAVFPIAATGQFARFPGVPFLEMVKRKSRWLTAKSPHLVQLISS